MEDFSTAYQNANEKNTGLIEKLFDAAHPKAVFSEPIDSNGLTVIQTSEIMVGMGYGFGIGGADIPAQNQAETPASEKEPGTGSGGGGGGGGYSAARPVATITIGPNGVTVTPVIDATKIVLAFFTTLGAMAFMLARMASGIKK